jgi:hypothetical protein
MNQEVNSMITTLEKKWRRLHGLSQMLKSVGVALLVGVVVGKLFGLVFGLLAVAIASVAFMGLMRWVDESGITDETVARHLNRTYPELEESADLFLKPNLSLLERLQLKRITNTMQALHPEIPSPHDLKPAVIFFAVMAALATLVLMLPKELLTWQPSPDLFSRNMLVSEFSAEKKLQRAGLDSVHLVITPPAYTQEPVQHLSSFDVKAPEGSRITWRLTMHDAAERVRFVFNNRDTATLRHVELNRFELERTVFESGFYIVLLSDTSVVNAYHKLEIIKDNPPSVAVTSPIPQTEIAYGKPLQFNLAAMATDDYGIAGAGVVATLVSGSGEAVKFKTVRLPLETPQANTQRRIAWQKTIDLASLGLKAGDEFYFSLEVSDNRKPQAGIGRSETIAVILKDSVAAVETDNTISMPVANQPEYFLSERQIIIDSEKLIKAKKNLTDSDFTKKSEDIGIDQKKLRLRYGKFLGEEFENAIGQHDDDDDGHNPQGENKTITAKDFTHIHDSAENATLFSDDIKAQLKAALSQMWQAELRLRTAKPAEALPFAYRALKLLKAVQQSSRLYVQRVAFELPPLKPDERRLKGDLTAIQNVSDQNEIAASEYHAAIREALRVIQHYKATRTVPTAAGRERLEKSGGELSQEALQNPAVYLDALQALRNVITQFASQKSVSDTEIEIIERAFLNLLPPAESMPERVSGGRSPVSRQYFNALEAKP